MREMSSSEFKARCLAVIDEVGESGGRVVISKRGKRVAELIRYTEVEEGFPQDSLRGTARIVGEIESPAAPAAEWRAANRT